MNDKKLLNHIHLVAHINAQIDNDILNIHGKIVNIENNYIQIYKQQEYVTI